MTRPDEDMKEIEPSITFTNQLIETRAEIEDGGRSVTVQIPEGEGIEVKDGRLGVKDVLGEEHDPDLGRVFRSQTSG